MFREQDHPRDKDGKFTFKNGGGESNNSKTTAQFLYSDSKKQGEIKKKEAEYKNKLLNILNNKATHADILYADIDKLEKKIKELGLITGAASNIDNSTGKPVDKKINDFGFDKSPWNLSHYYKLSNEYDKELSDFLHKNTTNPDYYGNDLRHQYVSAIFARNLGEKAATILGNLNEVKKLRSVPGDTEIDQINNEIGRNYAKKYPTMPRQELLKLMFKEHPKNQQIRIERMKKKNKNNLDNEYM